MLSVIAAVAVKLAPWPQVNTARSPEEMLLVTVTAVAAAAVLPPAELTVRDPLPVTLLLLLESMETVPAVG